MENNQLMPQFYGWTFLCVNERARVSRTKHLDDCFLLSRVCLTPFKHPAFIVFFSPRVESCFLSVFVLLTLCYCCHCFMSELTESAAPDKIHIRNEDEQLTKFCYLVERCDPNPNAKNFLLENSHSANTCWKCRNDVISFGKWRKGQEWKAQR